MQGNVADRLRAPGPEVSSGPTVAARPRRASRGSFSRKRHARGVWFVAPFTLMFLLFTLVPLVYAVYTSLFTTRLVGGTVFSGLSNYQTILSSSQFWGGMVRVLIFAAVQIPVMLAIALFFATVFDIGMVRWGGFFRMIYFLPFAVPTVVSAIMWSFLLEPEFGPFTKLAQNLGFRGADLLSAGLLLPMIIVIVIWEWTGYNMVIFYTALRSVPRDTVEAAMVEGATLSKIILLVKLPMVRPAVAMLALLNFIGALQLFVEPSILASFTPNVSFGYTPTIFLYNTAIGNEQYDLAAAGAVVLGVVITIISVGSLVIRQRMRSVSL